MEEEFGPLPPLPRLHLTALCPEHLPFDQGTSCLTVAGQQLRPTHGDWIKRRSDIETITAPCRAEANRIDLAESCGYREVCTPEGVALFETSYERYAPKADLTKCAFEAAVALEDNGYDIDNVKVAEDLPLTWLDSRDGSAIANMVRDLSGCISIGGVPRADPEPLSSGQFLLVFLAEAASESDAQAIATAAAKPSNSLRTQIGLASGRLCAVIIQTSFMADTPPLEDVHSLDRLRSDFERLLG